MKQIKIYFFKDDMFYAEEYAEMPDDIPTFKHREWLIRKFDHQYSGMTLIAHGEAITPVMISGVRRQ